MYGAVFLDIVTYSLWVLPLMSKNGREAARAVNAYRLVVRTRYRGADLLFLRADSNPSFSASGHGVSSVAADLHLALSKVLPPIEVTFSPPGLPPTAAIVQPRAAPSVPGRARNR